MINKALKSGFIEAKLKTINIFTGLFIAGLSIKTMGIEVIGLIQLLQAIFLFIISVLGFQVVQTALFHTISQYNNKRYIKKILASINLLLLFTIVIIFLMIYAYLINFSETGLTYNSEELLMILILTTLIISFDTFSALKIIALNAFGNFNKISYINGILVSISHVFLLIYLLNYNNLYWYLIITIIFSSIKFFILNQELKKIIHAPIFSGSFKYIFSMKLVNKSSYMGSLASPFISQLDKVLVGLLGSISAVPIYNFAQMGLSSMHSFLYQMYQVYLRDNSKNAKTKNFISKRNFFIQRWSLFFLAITGYTIMIWILPYLFYYLFSSEFGETSLYYIYLAAGQGIIVASSMMNNNLLLSYEKTKILAVQEWINSSLVFGLSLFLGSIFGGLGVALARMGFLFQFIHSAYYIKEIYGITLKELLMPYTLIGIFLINLFLAYLAWFSYNKIIYITLAVIITLLYVFFDSYVLRFTKRVLFLNIKKVINWKKRV